MRSDLIMDSDQETTVSIESVQSLLAVAQNNLTSGKFREALASAEIALGHVNRLHALSRVSSGRQPLPHTAELHVARVLMGLAHFRLGQLGLAADLLTCTVIPQESLLPNSPLTNEAIAIITAFAVLGSPSTTRQQLINTLTNSVESCCREFFDSDAFAELKSIGAEVLNCSYKEASGILNSLCTAETTRDPSLEAVLNQVLSTFMNKCMSEFISPFNEVGFDALVREFGLSGDEVVRRIAELIEAGLNGMGSYRLDMRAQSLRREPAPNDVQLTNQAVRDMSACIDQMKLLLFRGLVSKNNFLSRSGAC